MNGNESEIITDEELDKISAGRKYVYERLSGPKGEYYKCTSGNKSICIGGHLWEKWLEKLKRQGDTISQLKK